MITDEILAQCSSSESEYNDSNLDSDFALQLPCEKSDEIESERDDGSVCSETADGCKTPDISGPMDTVDNTDNIFSWTKYLNGFKPKMTLPSEVEPVLLIDVNKSTSGLNTF